MNYREYKQCMDELTINYENGKVSRPDYVEVRRILMQDCLATTNLYRAVQIAKGKKK